MRIFVTVKKVDGRFWGELKNFGDKHEVVAEYAKIDNEMFTFAGQHRLRHVTLKKNVNWNVDSFQSLMVDISRVAPSGPPPRRQGGR
ncbi:MAG TPA: hypothetical protein VJT81_12800 [Burkholderiales bacterium]|nr:hypothetical protein [Burkholderiales bacterium]